MDDDWIFLSYKIHGHLENMLVPEMKNIRYKNQWSWVVYGAWVLYKLYSYK